MRSIKMVMIYVQTLAVVLSVTISDPDNFKGMDIASINICTTQLLKNQIG